MSQPIIIEKNEGPKIGVEVNETSIILDEAMTLDLTKYERDFNVNIDICTNKFGFLVFGVSDRYAAQISIPARSYETVIDGTNEDGKPREIKNPLPLDMANVTITLWAKENNNND